jgi:hypothetical protein
MLYLALKAVISGILIAAASEAGRRWPTVGGLIVSLPLVSLLAFIWLWHDSHDGAKVAELSSSTFWFILPSMPLFLIFPALLRSGFGFWLAFAISVAITAGLYLAFFWAAPKIGLKL